MVPYGRMCRTHRQACRVVRGVPLPFDTDMLFDHELRISAGKHLIVHGVTSVAPVQRKGGSHRPANVHAFMP